MPTYLDPASDPTVDPTKKKPLPFGQALPGTMVNTTAGPGATVTDPALGDPSVPPPSVNPTSFTTGNGSAPGSAPIGGNLPAPVQGQETPGYQDASRPGTGLGGSPDFPSLPPGATPPPGYVDPQTGKTAGAAPKAPTAGPVPSNPGMPAPTTPGAPGSPTGTPGAPGAPPTTVDDAFKKTLIEGLTRGSPTLDDPTLQPAIAANRAAQQRGAERQRSILAERNAAGGTSDSGGATTGNLGIEADRAQQEGQFEGQTLLTAAQQQRDELMHYASLAGNTLSDEQHQQLQKQLADLDAQIKREQIASGEKLGSADIATRRYGIDTQGKLGEGELNLRELLGLLGHQDYLTGLGADLGKFTANRDDTNFYRALGLI